MYLIQVKCINCRLKPTFRKYSTHRRIWITVPYYEELGSTVLYNNLEVMHFIKYYIVCHNNNNNSNYNEDEDEEDENEDEDHK